MFHLLLYHTHYIFLFHIILIKFESRKWIVSSWGCRWFIQSSFCEPQFYSWAFSQIQNRSIGCRLISISVSPNMMPCFSSIFIQTYASFFIGRWYNRPTKDICSWIIAFKITIPRIPPVSDVSGSSFKFDLLARTPRIWICVSSNGTECDCFSLLWSGVISTIITWKILPIWISQSLQKYAF